MTSLIPRKLLFGNPEKTAVRLSPDGRHLSYLAPRDGVLNVWVAPVDEPGAAKPVTHDTVRSVRFYNWAFTSEHILYIQDKGGDENWHVFSANIQTGEVKDLTPLDGVQAQFQQVSHKFPTEVLVGLNDRVPQLHDIYRLNIQTGERTLVMQNNEGFVGYLSDDDYNIRFSFQMLPSGTMKIFKRVGDGWEEYEDIPHDDSLTTQPFGFDATGKRLFMMDSRGRNTAALVSVNVDTNERKVIAEDPKADLSAAMIHPTTYEVEAAAFTYERKAWQILDESIRTDLDFLKTVKDGDVEVVSRTLDDRQWIVAYLLDNSPVRYYHYDRGAKSAKFLFTDRPELEGKPLTKMHPVVVQTRDGWDMVCYYSLPLNNDTDGIPNKPLPMVLFVHGGPWARDNWGYHPYHQWMANRGYAVMSVNFRSSTGFGKDFTNAGNLEWGAKMHDDLIDAVEWAVSKGITTRDQVAIMGGSYGGYATLAGLTFTPDRFACGVDIVGPSNLNTLIESIPPYWEPMKALFDKRMGDSNTEEGREFLRQRSPLTHVEKIKRPLLIGQGANDPRVKRAESDQIVEAMQSKGIPVTYVLYPDEGHGFARPENSLSFTAVAEAFLSAHLEGEFEPIGDDFKGSSIEVLAGEDGVSGLAEALAQRSQAAVN